MKHCVLVLALASCDSVIDIPVKGEADYGRVYVCRANPCTKPNGEPGYEWCFGGSTAEIRELRQDPSCREIGISDRWWPALVGCAYDCDGRLEGPGANAHCGAYCP